MKMEPPEPSGEIGSYFGLEMEKYPLPFGQLLTYQSARAAFHAVLQASGLKQVFISSYICDSIVLAARNAGLDTRLYQLDKEFMPKGLPAHLSQDTGVIYVNYFGLTQNSVKWVLERFTASKVVIGQSQALFIRPCRPLTATCSSRKFVGLPGGGPIKTTLPNIDSEEKHNGKIERMRHLYRRFAYSARDHYAGFNAARLPIAGTTPKAMYRPTRHLLNNLNWQKCRHRLDGSWLVILCFTQTRDVASHPPVPFLKHGF